MMSSDLARRNLALAVFLALSAVPCGQAGDILRGGTAAPSANAPAANSGMVAAQSAKAQMNAFDSLARTASALQSVRTMQSVARKIAVANSPRSGVPSVPNGLVAGGLQVAPGVPVNLSSPTSAENSALWTGAKLPTQTVSGGKTRVAIVQTQSQALLNWATFNVGKKTQVIFDQTAGGKDASKWIAFNKINDSSGNPTQILGSLSAIGQIYLINQNGIIFGGSSQVNTHNLTASALPINDDLISRGLLNNPDQQFLFSALTVPALTTGTQPTFTPLASNLPEGKTGDVVVQKGAQLTAPTTASNVGGRITLVGANVRNAGTISTPDGQIILAAGLQVGFAAHAGSDASLRGLDVYVGQVADPASTLPAYAGTAINTGLIDAPRANTTIAGKNVEQNGVIHSTTSVSLNGRIDLLANYDSAIRVITSKVFLYPTATGNVTLGKGSVSEILPELDSAEKVVGQSLALNSQVNLQGRNIHLEGGARIFAPSANVTLDAGSWLENNGFQFVHDAGQIYLDRAAEINVAGTTNVEVPISNYIIAAQVRGSEVADSPLQRQGPFRGQTIYLDSRKSITFNGKTSVGTALADVSGYVGLIQRSVGELTTTGGTVQLMAGGSVVLQDESKIDVSGGWKNVQGGQVQTTRVWADGRLIDIADATPDQVYEGFYSGNFTQNFAKYGISNTFANTLRLDGTHYEAGYTEGAKGGTVAIAAPTMALDGTLTGQTVSGERQRGQTTQLSSLSLAFRGQTASDGFQTIYPKPPAIIFQTTTAQTPVAAFSIDATTIGEEREKTVLLSPDLLGEKGFGKLTVENNDGDVSIPTDVTIAAPVGGGLTIRAANIQIEGDVQAPGGSLFFETHNITQAVQNAIALLPSPSLPEAASDRGLFYLTGSLSTSGMLVDDRSGVSQTLPILNGGSISIQTYSADLAEGSSIDVSGGVQADLKSRITYGNAGSILIKTGQDTRESSVSGGSFINLAKLSGYSGSTGGTLSLQAQLVDIGGATGRSGALWLQPEFFSAGGFSQFNITGLGKLDDENAVLPGLIIAENTSIRPVIETLRTDIAPTLSLRKITLEPGQRRAVSLAFNAPGILNDLSSIRGDLVVGHGVSIITDPRASVSFAGHTVELQGSVSAPGGSISVTGGSNSTILFQEKNLASATVFLGADSLLSTAGTTLLTPDPYGRRFGEVLDGGSIAIKGNIVAASGAVLDVSGTADVLDFTPNEASALETYSISTRSGVNASLDRLRTVSQRVESNGGSITLSGGQMLYSDATLRGNAGSVSATGGSLSLESSRFQISGEISPLSPNLLVQQRGPTLPSDFDSTEAVIGQAIQLPESGSISLGHFAADDFQQGGFDSLALNGVVQFAGPVALRAAGSLVVATNGLIYADSKVLLNAPYIALGRSFTAPGLPEEQLSPFEPLSVLPSFGTGELAAKADWIDVGFLSLQGIGKTRLIATRGDIRGNGTLQAAGELFLTAGQIYPVTAGDFSIIAYDGPKPGSITITGSGSNPLPWSAGGHLGIYSSNIQQNGTLRAPFGSIALGWDGTGSKPVDLLAGSAADFPITTTLSLGKGSTTSVSAIDPATGKIAILPYGILKNGTTWIDPTGAEITLSGPAEKIIQLAGQNITLNKGARIDLRGGGDLYAYEWIKGHGGTTDILETDDRFAVIPDYTAKISPYAPYNNSTTTNNLISNAGLGYTNDSLKPGDRIYLNGSATLAAGYYTLLPARYALLEGAVLVTPKTSSPGGSLEMADGASLVSGYRYNDLSRTPRAGGATTQFEVASASVIRSRSEFADYFANAFFTKNAAQREIIAPRLPGDGGQLVLQATSSLVLQSLVHAQAAAAGRGGIVDISSPADILISGNKSSVDSVGKLVLDAAALSRFGAESLLIGGLRSFTAEGTQVATLTNNIIVDNAGSPLSAPDLILVANTNLTLNAKAGISAIGGSSEIPDNLLIEGNGVLLRVTSQPGVTISRTNLTTTSQPTLTIGADSRVSGGSITLDSSFATALDATARLSGDFIYLNSGQITLQLDPSGELPSTSNLVLSGNALQSLQKSQSLSLLSYSSIEIYGSGTVGTGKLASLSLHAGEIRGFANDGGTVLFRARDIFLDNSALSSIPGSIDPAAGTLAFHAGTIHLGENALLVDQFASLTLTGSHGIIFDGSGSLSNAGAINLETPLLTGAAAQTYQITAQSGSLSTTATRGKTGLITPGLGASLTLQGESIQQNGDILLPAGQLVLHATNGDLTVGGLLDVGGISQTFFDVRRTSGGGAIQLISNTGDVTLGNKAILDVSANPLAGDAGQLTISAAHGTLNFDGRILGQGTRKGGNGVFSLDIGTLEATTYTALQNRLQTGGFTEAQTFRIRSGDFTLDGATVAHHFNLSTDAGSITIAASIDASGETGGNISLEATGSLTLQGSSHLTVAAQNFDNAGKGGAIYLSAGAERNGQIVETALLDLQSGARLLLGVTANGNDSAPLGHFTGTLHLRAPQNATFTDLALAPIQSKISGASSIVIEGYRLFDLTTTSGAAGTITTAMQTSIRNNGIAFLGAAGSSGANYSTIYQRVLESQPAEVTANVIFAPGAEVINRTGNLSLGTTNSTATGDWNLSAWRFGPKSAPGVLTLRAAGNLVFYNALSDGFLTSSRPLSQHLLLTQNALLPANTQSWTYHLAAGADFTAGSYQSVLAADRLSLNSGSLLLGKNNGINSSNANSGSEATTNLALTNRFQVIRTGSGGIDIHTGRSIRFLNQFASIYTVGTQVLDPTLGGQFDIPSLRQVISDQGDLGSPQQSPAYRAQYSFAGGNVSLSAGENIEHLTLENGVLVADSQRELPNNWLYRRGYFNAKTGEFAQGSVGGIATTTWWVDFSNFFEGVGTLGGGNVSLTAKNDISNVDAVAPTNLRLTKGLTTTSTAYELGGGDLKITAGNNLDAGVYYVERGEGILKAGGSIITNKTRSPSLTNLTNPGDYYESETWLPTTLFLGKGSFDVSARNDVLLGPVANPFLLPGGFNNTFWFKSYFSSYASDSQVNVTSLGGSVTFRESITLPTGTNQTESTPILLAWLKNISLLTNTPASASFYQPWLRLNESAVEPFRQAVSLLPGTVSATAFTGDINPVGDLTLSPSASGNIQLLAGGAINGLQPNGTINPAGVSTVTYGISQVNLSDADPASIPGIRNPLAYQSVVGTEVNQNNSTGQDFLRSFDALFEETGATSGEKSVLQTQQTLHSASLAQTRDSLPVRLYASAGDISGVILFAPKVTRVFAGNDIADVAFYLQNLHSNDTSVVSSGRDLLPYSLSSPLRVLANAVGNLPNSDAGPLAGDFQIAGPGTLEVLTGRHLDLGVSPGIGDGTGAGITSVGNSRNPYLAFDGADIVAAAGLGALDSDNKDRRLETTAFAKQFLTPDSTYFVELGQTYADYEKASQEEKRLFALKTFYLVLRDAGRNSSVANHPDFGTYASGFAAIADLFPFDGAMGNISLTSRQIKTKNGGDVSLFAPGGRLTVGFDIAGTQPLDQGILTEAGGNVNIFTDDSVIVGTSRIFTLRGGNEIIWSSTGDIAAGAASKTVQSAPPTRARIDPQSGDVQTDLAGLATGGGVGVLASVKNVPAGDVDLIAPAGTVDAGDAGIRVTGNLNIAAVQVLNADNISVGGTTIGTPNIVVSVPNLAGLTAASNTAAASTSAASEVARQNPAQEALEELPSIITVEVLGYGG